MGSHLNPHLFENSEELIKLSGSAVVYNFVKKLNPKNKELAYIALIGIMGDMHEMEGPNKIILADAIESGDIKETRWDS